MCCAPRAAASWRGAAGSALRGRATATSTPMLEASLFTGLSWNPLSDYRQLVSYPFMVNALEAGTIVAVMAGVTGWFMVLRRQKFAGHTLSVVRLPGAAPPSLARVPVGPGSFTFCGL